MEFLKNLNKKLFEDNKNKKLIWIVLAGCIGILMISVSELTANDNSEYTERKDQYAFLAEEQTLMLETKLEEKISEISGAGKTSVCGHCGARLTITTNGTTRINAAGEKVGRRRYRYVCYNKTRKRADCTGQTGYTMHILDKLITEAE